MTRACCLAVCALVLWAAQAPAQETKPPDPAALVKQLGAPSFAGREAAERAIESIG